MAGRSMNLFLIVILGLAALGVGYQLVTDPLGLLTYLLVGAAIAIGIYFLFTRVIMKRMTMSQYQGASRSSMQKKKINSAQSKYQQAAKQQAKSKPLKKRPSRAINKRREDHNLTVIEGKKNRKKNRALF
ncbi:SA1362 family protein [Alteribacillus iranensis]|uniref:Uncharacterized protein n=1 Tax=Alteribacillus iranensis TaxID=930128 RepID=A0A1I1ZG07_9BACI|nr:SA1362 family protein [Alteribacillus iranensis]SFE30764.1 hypothetical protein SAMN05192532_101228 [Alteribacillus iranensis]